jgi:thymidylate synthase
MVPDELIGNLGDVHLYSNHIEQAKEQIGRKYTPEERQDMLKSAMGEEAYRSAVESLMPFGGGLSEYYDYHKIPYNTREPKNLPSVKIDDEPFSNFSFALHENESTSLNHLIDDLRADHFKLENYDSHPSIKAPLSN